MKQTDNWIEEHHYGFFVLLERIRKIEKELQEKPSETLEKKRLDVLYTMNRYAQAETKSNEKQKEVFFDFVKKYEDTFNTPFYEGIDLTKKKVFKGVNIYGVKSNWL